MQQKDLFAHYRQPTITQESFVTGLKVTNSLKNGELIEFVPVNGKQVKFYYCGPTVYSNTHLGHARTYLGIDVIRRTLRDYFGYDLISVMNITDVDDKIIASANAQQVEFLDFTKIWEKDFFGAMQQLGVELPDAITRVSDYIPEIVTFIEKIIANGYAYESNGDVYFDVQNYKEQGNSYPKMRPNGNMKELLEGEGATQADKQTQKKSPQDFALWKASKPNEPKWPSPWGEGRPGWHIECSVMASAVLGNPIDLHAGGIDLIFPHHDNSIAQSEACFKCDQWINYFIHLGHLDIEGSKMSKSLKNFITIEEVLKRYTARQLRLNFALHKYEGSMNYSEKQMQESIAKDKIYLEFFHNVNQYTKGKQITDAQKWDQDDLNLHQLFHSKKASIHKHLQNNFNFPDAIKDIDDIISSVNVLLKKSTVKVPLLLGIVQYTQFILNLIGLNYNQTFSDLTLPSLMDEVTLLRENTKIAAKGDQFDQVSQLVQERTNHTKNIANQVVDRINIFKEQIQAAALQKDKLQILKLCDDLRDVQLNELGIKIEDKDNKSIWKQYDPNDLAIEKIQAARIKELKEEEKALKLLEKQKEEEARQVPPEQFFKKYQSDKYSKFNEEGLPTHDIEGKELDEKQKKTLTLEWNKQKKLYQKYQK